LAASPFYALDTRRMDILATVVAELLALILLRNAFVTDRRSAGELRALSQRRRLERQNRLRGLGRDMGSAPNKARFLGRQVPKVAARLQGNDRPAPPPLPRQDEDPTSKG